LLSILSLPAAIDRDNSSFSEDAAITNDAAFPLRYNAEQRTMIELNRPQMYMASLIVLLLGLQFRLVDSIVLTEPASKFVAEKFESPDLATTSPAWFMSSLPAKKTITPPKWIGWSLLSIGGVMVLHSLAMRK
jgi:hypothetical protein